VIAPPGRLDRNWDMPYGVQEAMEAYKRVATAHVRIDQVLYCLDEILLIVIGMAGSCWFRQGTSFLSICTVAGGVSLWAVAC
jgi:hypothetical protein